MLKFRQVNCFVLLGRQYLLHNKHLHTKVPLVSTWNNLKNSENLPKVPKISKEQIDQLERLGLVELNNEEAVDRLTEAIKTANQLHVVDTEGVKPLDTVLENSAVYLREDEVTEGNCKKEVLMNAVKTEEDYFVAPPGNIPLKSKNKG
ncbi:hypothetical protein SNE40_002075 [Patella caerulea]|uniref:Glutamyl-tRNA(Gln) amidotransferase subunit C, mitochondrial n=1 Tax=Patella caerulea TaxID=87958 RepID=A0AAN8JX39_PATCE